MAAVLAGKLKGHSDAVLCCEASPSQLQLATGGEDGVLCLWDLRTHSLAGSVKPESLGGESILSIAHHPKDETSLYVSAGSCICGLDLRCLGGAGTSSGSGSVDGHSGDSVVFACFHLGGGEDDESEVNQVALDAKGKFLAAADDDGTVTVIDLARKEASPAMGRCIAADPSCMRLHSRCSGATFRLPSVLTRFINSCLPDFLLPCYASVCSGGLDSILLQWDFNTGKQLQAFDMGAEAALHESGGQVFNPPHVNAISVPATDKRPFCRMVAVARGDGAVVVYDADVRSGAQPSSAKQQGGGSRKKGKKKGKAEASEEPHQAPETEAAEAAEDCVPAGRVALLDMGIGGHTSSAAHVTFPRWSGGEQLLSGGNDSRVILWDWQRAPRTPSEDPRAAAELSEARLCTIDAKSKVNWLATADRSAENTFVANVTDTVDIYSLH